MEKGSICCAYGKKILKILDMGGREGVNQNSTSGRGKRKSKHGSVREGEKPSGGSSSNFIIIGRVEGLEAGVGGDTGTGGGGEEKGPRTNLKSKYHLTRGVSTKGSKDNRAARDGARSFVTKKKYRGNNRSFTNL